MFPLFETLAVKDGQILNIEYHQARYERSLHAYYAHQRIQIFDLAQMLQIPSACHQGLFRCRLDYNHQLVQAAYYPYQQRHLRRFKPIICNDIDYHLKYSNREQLNVLFAQRGEYAEIMIIKDGKITDCSIGNLIFKKENQWFTPDSPLLTGTQREKLLAEGKIIECPIRIEELPQFSEVRLINALNPLE